MQTWVIATGNPGKLKEFQNILGTWCHCVSLNDIGFIGEIAENGVSFAENSQIKALAVRRFLDAQGKSWPVLADDSGLEVDALGGAPGVYTARYAGEGATDVMNYRKLLRELALCAEKGIASRQARFVCVLTYVDGSGQVRQFRGVCEGEILPEPVGDQGFGYDPVFCPAGHTRSFAQMTLDEKESLSHRGRAIAMLRDWLITLDGFADH